MDCKLFAFNVTFLRATSEIPFSKKCFLLLCYFSLGCHKNSFNSHYLVKTYLHTKVPVFTLTSQRKNCFVKKWIKKIVKYQHQFLESQYEFWTNLTKNKEKDTFLYVDPSSSNLKEISEKKVEKTGNSHEEVKKKINIQEIWIKEGLKLMVHHSSISVKLILVVFPPIPSKLDFVLGY